MCCFLSDYHHRSRTNSSVGETEFVILQSSPIGHMHWQPVSISVGGNSESLSEHSSRSSSQLPSPGKILPDYDLIECFL